MILERKLVSYYNGALSSMSVRIYSSMTNLQIHFFLYISLIAEKELFLYKNLDYQTNKKLLLW